MKIALMLMVAMKRACLFLRLVYHRNDFYSPGMRVSPAFAWFIAKTVHK